MFKLWTKCISKHITIMDILHTTASIPMYVHKCIIRIISTYYCILKFYKYSIKIIHTSTFCPWTNFFKFVFLFNIIIHGKSLCTIFSNISIILIHFNKYICIEHVILCSIIRLISTYYYILKLYKYAIKILYTLSINGVINGQNTDILHDLLEKQRKRKSTNVVFRLNFNFKFMKQLRSVKIRPAIFTYK